MNKFVLKALDFAIEKHKNQKYGEYPYAYHLVKALIKGSEYIEKFSWITENEKNNFLAALCLHDVIEDCYIESEKQKAKKEIEEKFNYFVAKMVYDVTDEFGNNRKERKLKTYKKLYFQFFSIDVKLVDRFVNINQNLKELNFDKFKMYLNEHKDFKNSLYIPGTISVILWDEIEELLEKGKKIFHL